jgi:hypothetical protein
MDAQQLSRPGGDRRPGEGGTPVHRTPHPDGSTTPHPASPVPAPRASTDGSSDVGCIGPAWIVREVTHVPGVLRLAAGRLCFTSSRGPVFDLDLGALRDTSGADLAVDRRGRGFRITVGGERLHVQVVRPLGAVDPGAAFVDAVAQAADLPATRGDATAADTWRSALLSGVDDHPRRPAGRFAGRVRRGSAGSAPRT